jgi:predicted PurR-regulated permease PerM
MNQRTFNLERILGWIVLAMLAIGSLLVLKPFAGAIMWAIVLCFSSWPLYARLLDRLGGRRILAATIMSTAMVLVILMPFVLIGAQLADSIQAFAGAARRWIEAGPPQPPTWLATVPLVGRSIAGYWTEMASDSGRFWGEAQNLVEPVSKWLLDAVVVVGGGVVELSLSIFVAFFLFRDGADFARRLRDSVDRIGGEQGKRLLVVASNTVRGVVYGVLGTALAQALMAGVGFVIAGVPGAAFLALLTFFLGIIPFGVPLVWVPVTLWLFQQGQIGWGIFMLIWGCGVSTIDNFIKPWLISQGSAMPFLLIFFGVLGGALAFGFIGVFLGPTILAVGFRLVQEWLAMRRPLEQARGGT